MGYSEQFQTYREERGLTREQLASRAECHRNTVINVESGRPVRFATIVHLMQHLGYSKDSTEMKLLALLWLESVTGVPVSESDVPTTGEDREKHRSGDISLAWSRRQLTRGDLELLAFAARNRKVLNALRAIRDLVDDSAASRVS